MPLQNSEAYNTRIDQIQLKNDIDDAVFTRCLTEFHDRPLEKVKLSESGKGSDYRLKS